MTQSWWWREWLPNAGTLTLIGVTTTPAGTVVEADGPSFGRCPSCGRRSERRHSRYWRSLKDLPAQGRAIVLRVHVTRWRCQNGRCVTAIFADRLVGVSAARVHRTDRCRTIVHLVGHALGGRGGERLLHRLGMAVSDDTILRLLKRPANEALAPDPLHVVGIDDWAWQKGQQHFGTILVDLERRRVIDLLPTRAAGSVATWLAAHRSIQTISRDRHGPYAEAIRSGAPQAREVADRFHLVSNLRDAVQQELGRLRRFLVVPHHAPPSVIVPGTASGARVVRRTRSSGVDQERRLGHERRAVQLERFHLVKRLQGAGLSAAAIMRETGIGRKFVLTWTRLRELPFRNRMEPRVGMPEFYREYLWRRWTEGCQSVKRLMAEIQPLGYVGGYAGLAKLVARWRYDAAALARPRRVPATVAVTIVTRHVSPQVAAALLGQPRALLTDRQIEIVDALKHHCPGFTTMRRLMLSFRTILRVGKVRTLHRWMARATATEIDAMQRFVRKLRQDLGAVEGAVTERWSNGPVEGHINRLKTLRRQMYGRAGVDLLRARLLPLVDNAAAR
ncbi:MAG: ISL3 family transposase [Acidobacteriota bacterium]